MLIIVSYMNSHILYCCRFMPFPKCFHEPHSFTLLFHKYCALCLHYFITFHIKPILQVLLVHFIGKKQANRGNITCPRLLLLVNHRTRYQTPISLTPKPKFSTTLLGNLHDDMHVRPPGLGDLIITKVPGGLHYVTVLQITYSFIQ